MDGYDDRVVGGYVINIYRKWYKWKELKLLINILIDAIELGEEV